MDLNQFCINDQHYPEWAQGPPSFDQEFDYLCQLQSNDQIPSRRQSEEILHRQVPREAKILRRKSAESAIGNAAENKVVKRILKKTILARMKKRHSISNEAQIRPSFKAEERPYFNQDHYNQGQASPEDHNIGLCQENVAIGGQTQGQYDDYQGQLNLQGQGCQMYQYSCHQDLCREGQSQQGQAQLSQMHQGQFHTSPNHEGPSVQYEKGQTRPDYEQLNPHSNINQGMYEDELPEITFPEAILDFDDSYLICV